MKELFKTICLASCLILIQACSGSGEGDSGGSGNRGDTLAIFAVPDSITNNGDVAEVTVTLTQADGSAYPDGTTVFLFAEEGNIASQVSIRNGRAETNYVSGPETGLFRIWAQTSTLGLENNIYTTIEVIDAAELVGDIVLEVSPDTISRQGGEVAVTGTVYDPQGEVTSGIRVVFSTDRGTLQSNGAQLTSSSAGKVFDTLNVGKSPLNVDVVTITASAGAITRSETIGFDPNLVPESIIEYFPENPRLGQFVTFDGSGSKDPDGEIEEYEWQFPDGTTSNTVETVYAFSESGPQVVALEVTDDLGSTDREIVTVIVGDNEEPTAFFTLSPTTPRAGQQISFDASGSEDSDGSISEYRWAMGDGSTRVGRLVTYAYTTPGTYNVVLTVTDNNGGTGSATQLVNVAGNTPPIAVINMSNESPRVGDQVLFYAAGSYDPDGAIVAYDWNFGNNTGGNLDQHLVTYSNAGTYVVQLKVTDNEGGEGFDTKVITVADNDRPNANFTFSPTDPKVGDTVLFDASSSTDPDGTIESWSWDFGDNSSGSGEKAIHTYTSSGAYLARLTVTDNQGKTDTYEDLVRVESNNAPNASFYFSPNNPSVGDSVTFDASDSSDPDGSIENYRWSFGDGTTGNGMIVTHSFQSTSSYNVRLTVTDDRGADGTTSNTVTVGSGGEPTAALTVSPNTIATAGGTVQLDASGSTDPEDNSSQLRYSFTAIASTGVSINHPSTNFPQATASIGSLPVNSTVTFRVVVTDTDGNQDQSFAFVTVTNTQATEPVARFDLSADTLGLQGGTIVLDGSPTIDLNTAQHRLQFDYAAYVAGNPIVRFDTGTNLRRVVQISSDPKNPIQPGDEIVFALMVSDLEGNTSRTTRTVRFR